jgi:hypothetical protein
MAITSRAPNVGQLGTLARAHAVTLEQVDLANDIVKTRFAGLTLEAQSLVAASIIQALAMNYAAEVRLGIGK